MSANESENKGQLYLTWILYNSNRLAVKNVISNQMSKWNLTFRKPSVKLGQFNTSIIIKIAFATYFSSSISLALKDVNTSLLNTKINNVNNKQPFFSHFHTLSLPLLLLPLLSLKITNSHPLHTHTHTHTHTLSLSDKQIPSCR